MRTKVPTSPDRTKEAGVGELEETFLQAVMRRLEDLDGVEREVEEEAREYDFWARDVECG